MVGMHIYIPFEDKFFRGKLKRIKIRIGIDFIQKRSHFVVLFFFSSKSHCKAKNFVNEL